MIKRKVKLSFEDEQESENLLPIERKRIKQAPIIRKVHEPIEVGSTQQLYDANGLEELRKSQVFVNSGITEVEYDCTTPVVVDSQPPQHLDFMVNQTETKGIAADVNRWGAVDVSNATVVDLFNSIRSIVQSCTNRSSELRRSLSAQKLESNNLFDLKQKLTKDLELEVDSFNFLQDIVLMTRLPILMLRAKRRKFDDFKGFLVLISADDKLRKLLLKSREVTGESDTVHWVNDVLRSFREAFHAHSQNYQDLGPFLEEVSPALLDTERLQHALSSLQSRYPGESNAADFELSFNQLMESIKDIVSLSTFYQLFIVDGKESNIEIPTEAQRSLIFRVASQLLNDTDEMKATI